LASSLAPPLASSPPLVIFERLLNRCERDSY
jgi:hypothetical protein